MNIASSWNIKGETSGGTDKIKKIAELVMFTHDTNSNKSDDRCSKRCRYKSLDGYTNETHTHARTDEGHFYSTRPPARMSKMQTCFYFLLIMCLSLLRGWQTL